MPVFQVTSISPQLAEPPKKRARRFPYQWYILVRAFIAGAIGGLSFTLLLNIFGHSSAFFIFLPIIVSLAWAQPLRYNIGKYLSSTPLYLLLTICWTSFYYSTITVSQLLLYSSSNFPLIIPVASSLAWAIILDPVRAYMQQHIERRFNLRDRKTVTAIETFTSTL